MIGASYHIETKWAARKEATRSCAIRMARMLTGLSALHSAFAHWYQQAWTLEEAFVPLCKMPPQADELTRVFENGRHFTDVSHELMPTLGYSVSAWNGIEESDGISMMMHVGGYDDHVPFTNWGDMTVHGLRGVQPAGPDLINARLLEAVLLTTIDAWEPDHARIVDWGDLEKFVPRQPPLLFESGWMTYLAAPYARKVTPPPLALTEPVAGGGILMLATKEPFMLDNLQHVAVADAIQACLEPLQSDPRLQRP
jgi:immunity protein 52 of polymorphic toxin system